ncbi:MAG: glycoside hydrolase family 2, partial [Bacteroides sp.]
MKKILFALSFLTLMLTKATIGRAADANNQPIKLLLSNGWKVQSSAQTGTKECYDASIPATVMGVLTANGRYNNVLEGINYKQIDKSIFNDSWWFRKEFELPKLEKGKQASLLFDGLSYRANIWLNGKLIASKDSVFGPFRQFSFDITPYIKTKNRLAVEVFKANPGEPNIGFVDWNPRPVDESMGIFREVSVKVTGEVEMKQTRVYSKVNTNTLDEAWLSIETRLHNQSNRTIVGKLVGKIENLSFSVPVSLNAGEKRTISITPEQVEQLHFLKPRLWWCNQLGEPEMYELNLAFESNNNVSDNEKIPFGIREIKDYFTPKGARGFMLNGKKVLVRSAGWTDDIFLRDSPERNKQQVMYVKDMNLNSIRFENIWGTSQNIYDLCDQHGLMALVGWSCHWEYIDYLGSPCDEFGGIRKEEDIKLIVQSFKDQVCWLRNHPSIIAWFAGSDMIPRPEMEKKYLAILKECDDRPYIAAAKSLTSEISGQTGVKMNGPYEYVGPNYWYIDHQVGGAFGFNTETGIGAQLPVIESIKKIIPKDKLWPLNEVWNYHCTVSSTAMNSLGVLTETINKKYGEAKNLEDYLKKADLVNYEGTKAMFEAFRVNAPLTTGIVQWMLNSAWPSFYWQLYDYYLIPTAAYYSVKKANEPQQLMYNYKDNGIYATNATSENKKLKAVVSLFNLKSEIIHKEAFDLTIKASESTKVLQLKEVKENCFLSLQLSDANGTLLTDNFYCLSAHP